MLYFSFFSAYLVIVEMSGLVNVYMWDDASKFTLQMASIYTELERVSLIISIL